MKEACPIRRLGGKSYRCHFELTLHLIGGKWKPIILYRLADEGTLRFGGLRRAIPDVTERMLTRQLRELERDGLVRRTVYREVPPRVEYCLTNTGRTLIPILKDMCAWGAQYERDFGGEEGGEAKAAKESPQRGEAVVCSMRN